MKRKFWTNLDEPFHMYLSKKIILKMIFFYKLKLIYVSHTLENLEKNTFQKNLEKNTFQKA